VDIRRTAIVMTVGEIYFQCARAIVRSELWNPDKRVDPRTLPTPGQILAAMSENRVGGDAYDREWPERARQSLWRAGAARSLTTGLYHQPATAYRGAATQIGRAKTSYSVMA
jgi:hypothetical protein